MPSVKQIKSFAHYLHIVSKLQRTIILHQHKFPELHTLQDKIIWTPIDKNQVHPLIHHLERVCTVLQANSEGYITRHLYNNFRKDVEAFTTDQELQTAPFYLDLL